FELESVLLQNGKLTIDLTETNAPQQALVVNNIQADLRAHSGDRWNLQTFEGEALGARWKISGSLTNVLALAQKSSTQKTPAADWRPALRDVVSTFDKVKFAAPPEVTVTALGDVEDLAHFRAAFALRGAAAQTPWGE